MNVLASLEQGKFVGEKVSLTSAPLSEENTRSLEVATHNGWDAVSGIAVTRRSTGGKTLHCVFHSALSERSLKTFQWPPFQNPSTNHTSENEGARWKNSIKHYRDAFSDEHKLFDHVLIRTYGMASHVAGNTIATSITMHPSDMIQYAIANEQDSHLIISTEVDDLPPLQGL